MPQPPDFIKIGEYRLETKTGALKLSDEEPGTRLSPKATDVLIHLASMSQTVVTREELHEAVWAGRIVTDAQISKAINELRTAFQDNTEPRQFIETLPRRGYRLIPEAIAEKSDVSSGGRIKAVKTRRRPWIYAGLTIVIVAMIATYTLISKQVPELVPVEAIKTLKPGIAVLPFTNLSMDPANEYFSQGVAEELLTRLSRLKGLRVISRTSSFQFQGDAVDVREVGEVLGVSHLLEGTVRKSTENVRISIRLIETNDGAEVAAFQYDRKLDNIFALQTEIARSVTQSIQPELLALNVDVLLNHGTDNVAAFEAYLHGRYLLTRRSREEMAEATAAFQEAVTLDPDYLLAHSGLVDTYSLRMIFGFISPQTYFAAINDSVTILETSNVNLAEVLTTLGQINKFNGNHELSEDYFLQAINANEQYTQAYLWLADLYTRIEPAQFDKAVTLLKSARRLDPLSTPVLITLAVAQRNNGEFTASLNTIEAILTLEPDSVLGRMGLADHYRWVEGNLVVAAQVYYDLWQSNPEFGHANALGHIFLDMHEFELASMWLDRTAQFAPPLGAFFKFQWFLAQNQQQNIVELNKVVKGPNKPEIIQAYAEIVEGNYAQALRTVELIHSRFANQNLAHPLHAENLLTEAHIRQQMGQDNQALQIANRVSDYLKDKSMLGQGHIKMKMARVHILRGEYQNAIDVIREAFELGVRNELYALNAVYYDPIRNLQDFQHLEQEIKLDTESQRQHLRQYLPMTPESTLIAE